MALDLAEDAVALCHDLLRIDTSNPGMVERPAAEYVAERLSDAGLDGRLIESEPGRASYVARIEGDGSEGDALVVHGHLDVVPAVAADWQVHPFSGELKDACLWGRGAVDMKDMVAMILAVARRMAADGARPRRDLILCFFADEEVGGHKGARFLVDNQPELFEGATAAIGELGGFSVTLAEGLRLFPVQVAEKGSAHMRLEAEGTAGHGSMPRDDNAVMALAEAIVRLGRPFPRHVTPVVETFLREVAAILGVDVDLEHPDAVIDNLGALASMVRATLSDTISPTMLEAGQKVNVIPSRAVGAVDGRFLPGHEEGFFAEVDRRLGPAVAREMIVHGPPVEAPWDHPLVAAIRHVLTEADPAARPVPFMIPAVTDAKSLHRLGIKGYGFAPLLLPPDLDFAAMFHGVDERVPVAAIEWGVGVLYQLLTTY